MGIDMSIANFTVKPHFLMSPFSASIFFSRPPCNPHYSLCSSRQVTRSLRARLKRASRQSLSPFCLKARPPPTTLTLMATSTTLANATLGNENSARSFSDRSFFLMDVRAFGSWMSAPKCLFFQDFEGLTEAFAAGGGVLPPDVRRISARTSAGYPAPKLTLWAAFSFLKHCSVTPPPPQPPAKLMPKQFDNYFAGYVPRDSYQKLLWTNIENHSWFHWSRAHTKGVMQQHAS